MNVGINQKIAPIRFCFVIMPDNDSRFIRAMELAYSLWGGINTPILPYYSELPDSYRAEFNVTIDTSEFYKNTIDNYDPDIILIDEDIDKNLITPLANGRQIDNIDAYLHEILQSHNHAVSILEITQHFVREEFRFVRSDNVKFSIPKTNENQLLLQAFIGCIPNDLRSEIRDLFEGNGAFEEPVLDWGTMTGYQSTDKVDFLDLNTFRLRSWGNRIYLRGSALYFLRSNRLQDIVNFWNLRAAGWQIVPIPIDVADHTYFKNVTKKFTDWSTKQTQGSIASVNLLVGYQIPQNSIDQVFNQIKPDLTTYTKQVFFSFQNWFPRFWQIFEILEADHVKSHIPCFDTIFEHYESEGERIRFTPKELSFQIDRDLARDHSYKVILSLSLYDEHAEYAEALTGITTLQLRQLTFANDFRKWRLSPAGIHRFINRADDSISFEIPKSLLFFQAFFSNKSHKLSETVNSKLAKEVLKNMGGLHSVGFFLRSSRLKIIEQFEGGKEIVYSALSGDIKRQTGINKNANVRFFIRRLLDYKIIEMGATLKCSVCGQHGFFLPNQFAEKITCPICRNQYALPIDDPSEIVWSYRGIGPFSRANKADGVWAVFATLKLFKDEFAEFDGKISALIGFELIKHGRPSDLKEIDLGIILQNSYSSNEAADLIFCECKTYKTFTEKDIERMQVLGDEFPGAILTFATLNEKLNETEIDLIDKLVVHFQTGELNRPRNSILILTGKELLPEEFGGAFAEYKNQIRPYHRHNDFISALCELSVRKHLSVPNWWDIQDKKWNAEIQRRLQIASIVKSLQDRF